jgi:DNA-binding NarL/FixJ family response regulator
VVIAEDNTLLREGMIRLFDADPELDVVATCADLPSLLRTVAECRPDVVVTDIRMPPTGTDEGIRAATELRHSSPSVGVVVLSQYVQPSYAMALLEDGSHGRAYLLKDRIAEVEQLFSAIHTVAAGGSVIDPEVVDELVRARSQASRSPLKFLTARELEVLAEIAQGKSNASIAATLCLSARGIEKNINSIFSKLGLTNEPDVNRRVKAVLVYLANHASG